VLLNKLENGQISFAFIEGFFDKSKYNFEFFSREKFVPICSGNSLLSKSKVHIEDIFNQDLILREKGSGTRDIFENHIYNKNYTISNFFRISEIGSLTVIKELVKTGKGISFIYEVCVKKEIEEGSISKINLENFPIYHDFNFVYLKDSMNKNNHLKNFKLFKNMENFHK
jgi:DNA-binding transcriptional LysR family regulator